VTVSYTSREQVQVYRFSPAVSILVPLIAVFLQAFIPVFLGRILHLDKHIFEVIDLPLLVTIFFAVARRGPISGLFTGGAVGLLQDALNHGLLGVYGIAKTVIGYMASSLGVKIDVENPGTRLLMTFSFYVIHQVIFFLIARGLAGDMSSQLRWPHIVILGVFNGLVAIPVFAILDRFKQRV
jgi:rod shape-determining protein MreD